MLYIGYSLIFLLLASILKTILCAFRETADAGVDRLQVKYPKLKRNKAIYGNRFDLMIVTLSLLVVLSQTASALALFLLFTSGESTLPATVVFLLALSLLILLLIEILPQIVAEVYADRISAVSLVPVIFLSYLFWVFTVPLRSVGRCFQRRVSSVSETFDRPTPEDEIISLMEQADAHDMETHEKEFIRSVFEFNDTDVHEIMTPRIHIQGVEARETVKECVTRIREVPYSRYPVYQESLDNIQGIVHVKELLRILSLGKGDTTVGEVARPATFIPESMKIARLFKLMKQEHTHLAMVVDEYGGTAGVVALEDVIEELIGEIQDESDRERPGIVRLPDGSAMLEARLAIDEVNTLMGISIPESDIYDSVAGYIYSELNRIPEEGEILDRDGCRIVVHKASTRQIKTVRILKR